MALLWIAHNILNRQWYRYLTKGRYTTLRIINTGTVFAIFLCAISLISTGIVLSAHVFHFLNIEKGMLIARPLHMLSAYWCFIFLSFHLGLHWNQIVNLITKNKRYTLSRRVHILSKMALSGVCIFGIYSLIKQQFISYMFMKNHFVFFDYEQSMLSFFGEYVSILFLFATTSYVMTLLLKKKRPLFNYSRIDFSIGSLIGLVITTSPKGDIKTKVTSGKVDNDAARSNES